MLKEQTGLSAKIGKFCGCHNQEQIQYLTVLQLPGNKPPHYSMFISHSSPCSPPFPSASPFNPCGPEGRVGQKRSSRLQVKQFGQFFFMSGGLKIKLMHYFVIFSMRSFYRNAWNLEPSWKRRTGSGTIRARVPEFVQMSLLWKFILKGLQLLQFYEFI